MCREQHKRPVRIHGDSLRLFGQGFLAGCLQPHLDSDSNLYPLASTAVLWPLIHIRD